ncbi:Malonyl CoA-acyl carrier protein transacylase [Clostridioides difficile]|nr:Malonyl CoA-acyl carrier protein transacylase [Clostridioides difficile]
MKGLPYDEKDDIKELLKKHIRSSVLFDKTIEDMIKNGVNTFIEVGPGKVLSGFVKKINRSVKVLNIEDMESLNKLLLTLEEI